MTADSVSPQERGTLPRELIDFLIELSISLQKFAIYPSGHPMLATTVERLDRRLRPLLEQRETLSLGVARSQLVIEGTATEENHAVLRELAERLHHHHLGAVRISRTVTTAELRELLTTLGIDRGKDAVPLGLQPIDALPQWPGIRLYPLAYENLELLGDADAEPVTAGGATKTRESGARAARLWVGLARAALAGRSGPGERKAQPKSASAKPPQPEGPAAPAPEADTQKPSSAVPDAHVEPAEDAAADPAAVAQAIDEHHREEAYDQVIVGYLLQIADELRTADGRDAVALRSRVSKLLGSVKPETLRNLLAMGDNVEQRQRFVLDATQGMAVDAVIELLRAAADVSRQTISHSMLRLLSKLAVHAEHDTTDRRADADTALRDNVRMLVQQWTLEDPNPDAYRSVLEGMSKARPRLESSGVAAFPVEEERLLQMALEIGVAGESTWRAVETMVARRRVSTLVAMLERGPRPRVVDQIWERLATPERIRALIEEPQPDWNALEQLVSRVGLGAAHALVDALEDSEEPRRQGQIADLLVRLGDDVGALIARRLPQCTPPVQAQLLALLGRLETLPAELDAEEWARNRMPAVRREAIRMMCRRPETRDQAITLGLLDADERTVLIALNEAASDCPQAAVPILMNRVDRDDIPASLRALAIRAVASVALPDVVDWVLRFVMVGRKSFFGGDRLAPKSPELLAALAALGSYWPNDSRVITTLARASTSSDAEIRGAAAARAVPNVRHASRRRAREDA